MQKDLKIGMALGLALIVAAAIWLSTRQSLSVKSRMLSSQAVTANLPNNSFDAKLTAVEPEQVKTSAVPDKPAPSNEPELLQPPAQKKDEKTIIQRFHTVCAGETLSDISYKYYGSANKWHKIRDANQDVIKDANRLIPGTRLIIPE